MALLDPEFCGGKGVCKYKRGMTGGGRKHGLSTPPPNPPPGSATTV